MDKKLKTAFTLVELLVVIAIVGILSGLIIVGMNTSIQSATTAKAQIFSSSLRDSMMANLVSEWKFDGPTAIDAIATANDVLDTWGSNNAAIVGGAEPVVKGGSSCIYGKCLSFDGVDYITIANYNFGNDYTIDLWVKLNVLPASQPQVSPGIIGKASSFTIDILKGSGAFYYAPMSGTLQWLSSTKKITDLNWHNLVLTCSGAFRKFYIDGIGDASDNLNTAPAVNANALLIGKGWSNGTSAIMDNVRIYNATIPTSQIKEQYYSGITHLYNKKEIDNNEYLLKINQLINTLASK